MAVFLNEISKKMDLRERVMTIMEHEGMSSTKFADEIGVQRPKMSHIVSGRNNPSLDILQKILVRLSIFWTTTIQRRDLD